MFREVHRSLSALSTAPGALAAASGPPISKARALVQIVLTIVLVPICLWALFAAPGTDPTARSAAGALLGAIVAFWLKD